MSSSYPQQTYALLSLAHPPTSRSALVLNPLPETDARDAGHDVIPSTWPTVSTLRGPRLLIEVIDPPANRLIDLIKAHYPAYEQRTPLPDHVRHAMQLVQSCHTDALGGHVERCPNGHMARVFYNRCGHRFCPRCAGRQRRQWLLNRRAKLLPVRHYHAVFTLPHAFNAVWRLNFQRLGNLLFHTSTDALRALLADPKWLGAEPGITVTLETWDDRLGFHPHVHCLVTGGGLTPEGTWKDAPNPRCLVAVSPLMWAFRQRFCQGLTAALEQDTLRLPDGTTTRQWLNRVNKANRQPWEVFIAKPPEDGGPDTEDILRYQAEDVAGGPLSGDRLGSMPALSVTQLAYLKSVPLHDTRLEEAPEGQVSFRWGVYDPATGRRERDQRETLPVDEFLRRYLQHVPPSGYQTVRHYGLYTSAKQAAYVRCGALLADRTSDALPSGSDDDAADTDAWIQQHTCPVCGTPLMVSRTIPSSVTGRIIPRIPIGHVFVRSASLGGGHDP
jgi:hypothetical protein